MGSATGDGGPQPAQIPRGQLQGSSCGMLYSMEEKPGFPCSPGQCLS